MRIVGIDFGERRIGVAAADDRMRIAMPVTTITVSGDPVDDLVYIIRDQRADELVVGLPLSLSGAEGPQAQRIREVVAALEGRVDIPIRLQDERLTTRQAERAGPPQKKKASRGPKRGAPAETRRRRPSSCRRTSTGSGRTARLRMSTRHTTRTEADSERRINLKDKLALFADHWHPRIIAQVDMYYVKLAKLQGEFLWHSHMNQDEMFLVLSGEVTIKMRDKAVTLTEGDIYVVPRGVDHCPEASRRSGGPPVRARRHAAHRRRDRISRR